MLKHYYQQELYKIRELAQEFSKLYPMLAPLLGERGDPDVERLLEGFAFLMAQLQERIDQNLPRVYASFAQIFYPQLLRPYPCATTLQFQPTGNHGQKIAVAKNTETQSISIENEQCIFRTIDHLTVNPLQLTKAYLDNDAYGQAFIALQFDLLGINLQELNLAELILHVSGDWNKATTLYHLLLNGIDHLVLKAEGMLDTPLPQSALQPHLDAFQTSLYPESKHVHNGFRLLQEYFIYPRKFLYLRLGQLDTWGTQSKATQFTVCLYLKPGIVLTDHVDFAQLKLHCVPAINLQETLAEPFVLDYRLQNYRIKTSAERNDYQQIFDLTTVTGYQQGSAKPIWYTREFFEQKDGPQYELIYRQGSSAENWDYYLSFSLPDLNQPHYQQTISSHLLTCNGKLPEYLHYGDICLPGANTPERLTFQNIDLPSRYHSPKMSEEFLWQVQGLLLLNYLSFLDADRFKALLKLFLPKIEDQSVSKDFNSRFLQGIEQFTVQPCERLVAGEAISGQAIRLTCNSHYFLGNGDLYLFGQLLWQFFTMNTPIGGFYTFTLINSASDEKWTWEPNLRSTIRRTAISSKM